MDPAPEPRPSPDANAAPKPAPAPRAGAGPEGSLRADPYTELPRAPSRTNGPALWAGLAALLALGLAAAQMLR